MTRYQFETHGHCTNMGEMLDDERTGYPSLQVDVMDLGRMLYRMEQRMASIEERLLLDPSRPGSHAKVVNGCVVDEEEFGANGGMSRAQRAAELRDKCDRCGTPGVPRFAYV